MVSMEKRIGQSMKLTSSTKRLYLIMLGNEKIRDMLQEQAKLCLKIAKFTKFHGVKSSN